MKLYKPNHIHILPEHAISILGITGISVTNNYSYLNGMRIREYYSWRGDYNRKKPNCETSGWSPVMFSNIGLEGVHHGERNL